MAKVKRFWCAFNPPRRRQAQAPQLSQTLLAHIDDRVLDAQGRIDAGKLDLIGRLGGAAYSRSTRERFELSRPG